MKLNKFVLLALFAIGASLAVSFGAHADETRVAQGPWGSSGPNSGSANMMVSDSGASIDLGCGIVKIEGTLNLDANGKTTVPGMQMTNLPMTNAQGTPVLATIEVNGDMMNLLIISSVPAEDGFFDKARTSSCVLKRGMIANFAHCA